jgi:arabinofuranosyltransferase
LPAGLTRFIEERGAQALFAALFSAYAVILVRTAWVCDDAYITLRTVDNLVSGHGLTWNAGERVQAYTHPLWMFLLSAACAVTREPFHTTIVVSLALSLAAFIVAFAPARGRDPAPLVPVVALLLSRAFVDYSTSGLEQPLLVLLLALFFRVRKAREAGDDRLLPLSALTALVALTRPDASLLVLPALIAALWRGRSLRAIGPVLLGFLPLILWELFSLFYYGFPLPNTAYAKLGHGLPRELMIEQGLVYLADSLGRDPLTLPAIMAGALAVLLPRCRRHRPLAAGIALYLAYVVWIGGDFMSGRFLAPPLFVAALLAAQALEGARARFALPALAAAAILGLAWPRPTVTSGADFGTGRRTWGDVISAAGVADERAYWYHCAGWLSDRRPPGAPHCGGRGVVERLTRRGERFLESGGVGFVGYHAGPEIRIFDTMGVVDPLLARLPSPSVAGWRPGHFPKAIPAGYVETLRTGVPSIEDGDIAEYQAALAEITSGDLLAASRLARIWKMNTGACDHLLPAAAPAPYEQAVLPLPRKDRYRLGERCTSQSMMAYREGLLFEPKADVLAGAVELDVSDDAEHRIEFLRDGQGVGSLVISAAPGGTGIVRRHCLHLNADLEDEGFDTIRWRPLVGDFACLGRLRLRASCGEVQ